MSAKHTPGPWFAHTSPPSDAASVWAEDDDQNEDAAPIAVCTDHERRSRSVAECQANALLIAAAPDMLAALKSIFENPLFELGAPKFDGRPSGKAKAGALAAWDVLVESARESIAKAEGRSC